MKQNFNLKYTDLTIRTINETDIDDILEWRNHPAHRICFNNTAKISKKIHYTWFNNYLSDENDFIFIACDKKNKYGQFSIYHINFSEKTAEFGRFVVNPIFKGSGIMQKVCNLAICIAKEKFNLNLLYLEVKQTNETAIHICKQAGFAVVGINKQNNLIMHNFLV